MPVLGGRGVLGTMIAAAAQAAGWAANQEQPPAIGRFPVR
jgi:hypothetical protein